MDFDVSSINSMYQQYVQDNANSAKAQKLTNGDYSNATDDELMDACKQFEAYFLEQTFKEMMKTVNFTESDSSATNTLMDYYKDTLVQEAAKKSSETQNLGLAQMLYEQMKRNYEI